MRILITGSRDWTDQSPIQLALRNLWQKYGEELTIVHGGCPSGADKIADDTAIRHGLRLEVFPADWSMGRGAGHIRNKQMVDSKPDLCYAFIKNGSKGASGCLALAAKAKIPYTVWTQNYPT